MAAMELRTIGGHQSAHDVLIVRRRDEPRFPPPPRSCVSLQHARRPVQLPMGGLTDLSHRSTKSPSSPLVDWREGHP